MLDNTTKIDKRVKRSKDAIQKALLELLLKNSIEDINITELTNKANVNRATFYLHYNSIYDVLDEIENDIVEELSNVFSQYNGISIQINPYPVLKLLTEKLAKYDSIAKFLTSSKTGYMLLLKLKKSFINHVYEAYTKNGKVYSKEEYERIERFTTFSLSGTIDVFQKWYNSPSPKISLEALCQELASLITFGLKSIDIPINE